MTNDARPDEKIVRQRQRSGARMTAGLLIGFVVLVFAITIAKLMINQ